MWPALTAHKSYMGLEANIMPVVMGSFDAEAFLLAVMGVLWALIFVVNCLGRLRPKSSALPS